MRPRAVRQHWALTHLLLLSCVGCTSAQTQSPLASNGVASTQAVEPAVEPVPVRKPPFADNPITSPGQRVPNSTVYLPSRAVPDSLVHGRAPIGSQVRFMQQDVEVQADGRFALAIPATAHGQLNVRIIRPSGQTPITLKINIETP